MAVLKNYMEDIVEQYVESVIINSGGCLCEKCRFDVMAIALNSLPCKYIVTDRGEMYTRLSTLRQQFEVDILSAIAQAVVIVKESPRHEGSAQEEYI